MEFEPKHNSNNLVLRFIANYIFSPIAHFFLDLYLRWGTTYSANFDVFEEDEKVQ